MKTTIAVLAALCASTIAVAQPTQPHSPIAPAAVSGEALKRETRIAAELRCLVCQNQTIAESSADLALDLRRQVREQIAAGKSDREIIDYMTARYGDFVLYRPPLKGTTLLLWFGPALLLAAGALFAWRVLRARRTQSGTTVALSDSDRERAAKLLGE